MDENMSEEEKRDCELNFRERRDKTPKRFKTDNERSEESSSSSNATEQESASTSGDSGFPRSRNSRNRNYRVRTNNDNEENGDTEIEAEVEIPMEGMQDDEILLTNQLSDDHDSDSTVLISESDDSDQEECTVLKKEKPKHNWFVVPEIINRQVGYSSKLQSSQLFQRRCYGSLHSVQRLELMAKLEEHEGCVNSLNFHHDGSLLASGSDDLKVVIWDWKLGKCLLKYDTKHRGNVFQSKFLNLSGDLHIATCARDGQVRIAQVSREEGLRDNRKLGAHKGPCHKLAVLNEQPHVILSAGEDGLVMSHDVRRNKPDKIVYVRDEDREVALYSIHNHPLNTHEFCVSGRDDVVRVYDQRKTASPLSTYFPFKRPNEYSTSLHVTCAVYNHDGSQILASYNDADIFLFDAKAPPGDFIHRYQGHRNGATIKGVNFFGPKSEFIVSGSDCGNIYYWEKDTESIVQWMLADDNGVINCLEPHPQLPFICTSGLDWDVKVWVPSCETAPAMTDLEETIKNNKKSRVAWNSSPNDINESQMLWMLWRHLRSTNRMQRILHGNPDIMIQLATTQTSSSASSLSGSWTSGDDHDTDDDLGSPMECNPS